MLLPQHRSVMSASACQKLLCGSVAAHLMCGPCNMGFLLGMMFTAWLVCTTSSFFHGVVPRQFAVPQSYTVWCTCDSTVLYSLPRLSPGCAGHSILYYKWLTVRRLVVVTQLVGSPDPRCTVFAI